VAYEDKRYQTGPAPDYDISEWKADKFNLGMDFPNLPYYFDDDVKLSQSTAIMRYLAEKHSLAGRTADERWKIDLLAEQATDIRNWYNGLVYEFSNVPFVREEVYRYHHDVFTYLRRKTSLSISPSCP